MTTVASVVSRFREAISVKEIIGEEQSTKGQYKYNDITIVFMTLGRRGR